MYVNRWSGRRNASRRGGVQAVRGALPTPLVLGPGPAAQRRNTGSGAAGARRPRRDRVRVADQYRAVQGRLATRSGLEPSRWRATARIQIGCPTMPSPNILSRHKAQGADELQPNNERSRVAGRRSSPAQDHPAVGTTNHSSHDTDSAGREAWARIPPAPRASLVCYVLHVSRGGGVVHLARRHQTKFATSYF